MFYARGATATGDALLAYGDYGINTGPIDVISVAASGTQTTLFDNFATEQTTHFRTLNDGWLWGPCLDPSGIAEASIVTNAPDGVWRQRPVTVPGVNRIVHMHDVAQTSDGTLFVSGVRDIDPSENEGVADPGGDSGTSIVWKSVDGGVTWTEDLVNVSRDDGNARFFHFGKIGDNLYIAVFDRSGYYARINGVWSSKITGLDFQSSDITVWGDDTFAVSALGGWKVLGLDANGLLEFKNTPVTGTRKVFDHDGTGYLHLTGPGKLMHGDTQIATLLEATGLSHLWSATLVPGAVWLCDSENLWRYPRNT